MQVCTADIMLLYLSEGMDSKERRMLDNLGKDHVVCQREFCAKCFEGKNRCTIDDEVILSHDCLITSDPLLRTVIEIHD